MEIKNVCVVGCGLMGRQISMNAAIYGYNVALFDNFEKTREDVKAWAEEYLAGRISKGRLSAEQVADIKTRYTVCDTLESAAANADLVIEAIVEIEEAKADLFRKLDKIVRSDTILATNSSYLLSSLFVDCVSNPSRLANAHYYNPALVMKLVEVVQSPHTSPETAETLMEFFTSVGKTPVLMKKELRGFIANHMVGAIHEAAFFLVENGYCSFEEVDLACENGLGHKTGPFRLIDLTGVDLSFTIRDEIYKKTGKKEPGYDILKELVDQGRLGMKVGKGFYDYD